MVQLLFSFDMHYRVRRCLVGEDFPRAVSYTINCVGMFSDSVYLLESNEKSR